MATSGRYQHMVHVQTEPVAPPMHHNGQPRPAPVPKASDAAVN